MTIRQSAKLKQFRGHDQSEVDAAAWARRVSHAQGVCSIVPSRGCADPSTEFLRLAAVWRQLSTPVNGGDNSSRASYLTRKLPPHLASLVYLAARFTPIRIDRRLEVASALADRDLAVAIAFLWCGIPARDAVQSDQYVHARKCLLPYCSSCTRKRSRQLLGALSTVFVDRVHNGEQLDYLGLSLPKVPGESALQAYKRLDRNLTRHLASILSSAPDNCVTVISTCFEDAIDGYGHHHVHAHLLVLWDPQVSRDQLKVWCKEWRDTGARVFRRALLRPAALDDGRHDQIAFKDRIAYHRKANITIRKWTPESVRSLAEAAVSLHRKKLRRAIWLNPRIGTPDRPTLACAMGAPWWQEERQ